MSDKVKQTFTTKLYEVAASDELRPIMSCIHFKEGYAYASDGHIAIKQTLELHTILQPEYLDGQSLHRDSYKAIMTFDKATADDSGITCTSATGQEAFFPYFEFSENEKAPDINSIIPTRTGSVQLSFIGINSQFLARLGKALHNPGNNMRLQFTGIDRAIMVDVIGVEDQQGIIMPVILNDSLF